MSVNVLFAASTTRWGEYEGPLADALDEVGVDAKVARDFPPEAVDYIVYAPNGPLQDFAPYTRLKAVLNLWAGVEDIVGNPTLTVPLTRMVDYGLTEGMVEYVTGHVLRHHLGIDQYIQRIDRDWVHAPPPLARDRRVGILGLGELGAACARAVAALNFPVTGWSRSRKDLDGIRCLTGDDGLSQTLASSDILVLLLPLTGETTDLLDDKRLAALPKGAVVINPARGPMIVDAALVAALDSGHLSHATLDVFREEPLPQDHPFWAHPKVTITPHIASETRASSSARVIAENIRRGEAREPFLHLVDRGAGY